jgi:hypothetical protein
MDQQVSYLEYKAKMVQAYLYLRRVLVAHRAFAHAVEAFVSRHVRLVA